MKIESKQLWKELGNIPTNENDEIEERFLHFDIGTNREEIWHWFEEEFNLSVAEDLITVQSGKVRVKACKVLGEVKF